MGVRRTTSGLRSMSVDWFRKGRVFRWFWRFRFARVDHRRNGSGAPVAPPTSASKQVLELLEEVDALLSVLLGVSLHDTGPDQGEGEADK